MTRSTLHISSDNSKNLKDSAEPPTESTSYSTSQPRSQRILTLSNRRRHSTTATPRTPRPYGTTYPSITSVVNRRTFKASLDTGPWTTGAKSSAAGPSFAYSTISSERRRAPPFSGKAKLPTRKSYLTTAVDALTRGFSSCAGPPAERQRYYSLRLVRAGGNLNHLVHGALDGLGTQGAWNR